MIVNWLELFVQEVDSESFGVVVTFREKPVFQEVGSGLHKKFGQLLDHNWFSCESVDARDLKTFFLELQSSSFFL